MNADVPIRAAEQFTSTGNMVGFSCICLHSNSALVLDAEEVISNLEPFLPFGKVNTTDVHYSLELTLSVVAQERKHGNEAGRCGVDCQFIFEDRKLLNEFRE